MFGFRPTRTNFSPSECHVRPGPHRGSRPAACGRPTRRRPGHRPCGRQRSSNKWRDQQSKEVGPEGADLNADSQNQHKIMLVILRKFLRRTSGAQAGRTTRLVSSSVSAHRKRSSGKTELGFGEPRTLLVRTPKGGTVGNRSMRHGVQKWHRRNEYPPRQCGRCSLPPDGTPTLSGS